MHRQPTSLTRSAPIRLRGCQTAKTAAIAGASHEGLVGEQKYAAATTQAILDVVTSVRSAAPLAR